MASSNSQRSKEIKSLICSLCLDVFEEATLLKCGHTFCRKCLERYDECHPKQPVKDSLSMLCLLCQQGTELGAEGIAGLPSNVSLNNLVEEFSDISNPRRKLYDDRPRCSQCGVKPSREETEVTDSYAVVFCCNCDIYMCEQCLAAHKQFELVLFKGHQVMPVKDLISGKQKSIIHQFDRCPEHTAEAWEFYSADCRAVICHKCMIVKYNVKDQKIRERADIERELRKQIAGMVTRCENEKNNLEVLVRETEQQRRSAKASLQEVTQQIDLTFADLQRQLEERKKTLKAEVEAVDGTKNCTP